MRVTSSCCTIISRIALRSITSILNNMATLPKNIGWIGLGLMGFPMASNLLKKTSEDTQLYVYDVVQDSIDKLVKQGNGRVHACGSSKEVTDKSVCHAHNFRLSILARTKTDSCSLDLGLDALYGTGRQPRTISIPDA